MGVATGWGAAVEGAADVLHTSGRGRLSARVLDAGGVRNDGCGARLVFASRLATAGGWRADTVLLVFPAV